MSIAAGVATLEECILALGRRHLLGGEVPRDKAVLVAVLEFVDGVDVLEHERVVCRVHPWFVEIVGVDVEPLCVLGGADHLV